MIARCDRCDRKAAKAGHLSRTGYRWNPMKAGLGHWTCAACGGPLRGKRKGDTESNIVRAHLWATLAIARTRRKHG